MTPFSALAEMLAIPLSQAGYEPLDVWRGQIGGDRHGVLDYTWISRRLDGRHCFASLFLTDGGRGDRIVQAEVWAAVEQGTTSPRSLVLRVEGPRPESASDAAELLEPAMLEATRRAEQMRGGDDAWASSQVPQARAEVRIERAPYWQTRAAVRELFEFEPERVWRNRDVLEALIEKGHMTDRAAVNRALSDLASAGEIHRARRGRYRKS